MKKIFFLLITLTTLAIGFTGCKRGEDDPSISFSSRDSRLMREWRLTAVDQVDSLSSNGTTTTSTLVYNGTTMTYTLGSISFTYSYALNITFGEGGVLTVVEVNDGDTESDVTTWQWASADKKKTFISLNSAVVGGLFHLSRLSSKEMVAKQDTREVDDPSGNNIDISTTHSIWTFEAL